jgi:hypothetical protein
MVIIGEGEQVELVGIFGIIILFLILISIEGSLRKLNKPILRSLKNYETKKNNVSFKTIVIPL